MGERQNAASSGNTPDEIVAGQVPKNPSELINSKRMRELIREAEASYDPVVLDTPTHLDGRRLDSADEPRPPR